MRTMLRKIRRDLEADGVRAVLALLASAIGVVAAGSVLAAWAILDREIEANFLGTSPPAAVLWVDRADEALAEAAAAVPGVARAEARGLYEVRVRVGGDWRRMLLFVVDDFDRMRIATFRPVEGAWPPGPGEILIERSAVGFVGRSTGDTLRISAPHGRERDVRISGVVHDPAQSPGWVDGLAYGYATLETLRWLGEAEHLDELLLTVSGTQDEAASAEVARRVAEVVQARGVAVSAIETRVFGRHPHADQMDALLFLIGAFGVLALALGAVLTADVVSARMASQVAQIGAMKAMGARRSQIAAMALASVGLVAAAAVVLALPVGAWVGRQYAAFTAGILNFDLTSDAIGLRVFAAQALAGLLVPLAAAAPVVLRASRVPVREALAARWGGEARFGQGRLERLALRLRGARPLVLSLRNTLRQRTSLALTLGTLTAGGATFLTAFDVGTSWERTIDALFAARRYDIRTLLTEPVPAADAEALLGALPGVEAVESWAGAWAQRIGPDDDEIRFRLTGVPPETDMIDYPLVEGRWLLPTDHRALVINHEILLDPRARMAVGDRLLLDIGGERSEWTVVGAVREIGVRRRGQSLPAAAYTSRSDLTAATGTEGLASELLVAADRRDDASLAKLTAAIESAFDGAGLRRLDVQRSTHRRQELVDHIYVIRMFLLAMAAMVATVGALALASAMGVRVLSRTREIGVMRAVGATRDDVFGVIVAEGALIGLASWVASVIASIPLGVLVGDRAGHIFIRSPLEHAFSPGAALGWLALVLLVSVVASAGPALAATRPPTHRALARE